MRRKIILDANPISIKEMLDWREDPLKGQPLVFMNACSSVQGDVAYPSPFISHFLGTWGASGFVGTDWEVPAVFADLFARRVFERLSSVSNASIVRAFHDVTKAAADRGNPFGLIYGLYVRPEMILRLRELKA